MTPTWHPSQPSTVHPIHRVQLGYSWPWHLPCRHPWPGDPRADGQRPSVGDARVGQQNLSTRVLMETSLGLEGELEPQVVVGDYDDP